MEPCRTGMSIGHRRAAAACLDAPWIWTSCAVVRSAPVPSQRFETAHRHSQRVSVHRHAAPEVKVLWPGRYPHTGAQVAIDGKSVPFFKTARKCASASTGRRRERVVGWASPRFVISRCG
jgi:hypothetical protein